jgi:hypothetical protein
LTGDMRSGRGALGAMLLAAGLLTAGLCSCGGSGHALRPKSPTTMPAGRVRIPDVFGDGANHACTVLVSAGLECGADEMVSSDDVPLDDVVASDPGVGRVVARGSEISLLVSGNDASVLVPNVVGETAEAATSTLGALGLTARATCGVASAPDQDGAVLAQDPASRLAVAAGSSVTITVAQGAC